MSSLCHAEVAVSMKVLIVANSDWGMYNFRLPLAAALLAHGVEVVLLCPEGPYSARMRKAGHRVLDWHLRRRSLGPIAEAGALLHLVRLYRKERPDAVHHFTVKPNIYGTLAASWAGVPHIVNTWTGLGFVFSQTGRARAIRVILIPIMKWIGHLRRVWTVFQIQRDLQTFIDRRLVRSERAVVIAGTGVDVSRYSPIESAPSEAPIVLMASRLLWEKGVGEFVQAATLLRDRGVATRLWLAGAPDPGNPGSLTSDEMERLEQEGAVTLLGHRSDMPDLLRQASVFVLPTYYNEGVPLSLLEAAATGLPLVATDIEGCQIVVHHCVNGFIVPRRDSEALAEAIAVLAADPELRLQMGRAGREIAVNDFDQDGTVKQYLNVYRRLGLLREETRAAES